MSEVCDSVCASSPNYCLECISRLPAIAHSDRRAKLSDMRDADWNILRSLLPHAQGFARPRTVILREIFNAIFYVKRSSCQWCSNSLYTNCVKVLDR